MHLHKHLWTFKYLFENMHNIYEIAIDRKLSNASPKMSTHNMNYMNYK